MIPGVGGNIRDVTIDYRILVYKIPKGISLFPRNVIKDLSKADNYLFQKSGFKYLGI